MVLDMTFNAIFSKLLQLIYSMWPVQRVSKQESSSLQILS